MGNAIAAIRKNQIRRAVLEYYLEHQKGLDLTEIAEKIRVSESTVRRYIWEPGAAFLLPGLMTSSYGRNPTYLPTHEFLREEILRMRRATGNVEAKEWLEKTTHKIGD